MSIIPDKFFNFGHRKEQKKSGKRKHSAIWQSLISSIVISGVLLAMLIGSTFAWYSAVTETPVQVIKTGNLDAQLSFLTDNNTWEDTKNTTVPLFGDLTLDPDTYAYVVLKAANVGEIDLTYELRPLLLENKKGVSSTDGSKIDLSKILKMEVIDLGETLPGNIENTVKNAVKSINAPLLETYSVKDFKGHSGTGSLSAKEEGKEADSHYYAVAIYAPAEANLSYDTTKEENKPTAKIKLQLRTSQLTSSAGTSNIKDEVTEKTSTPLPWDGVTYIKPGYEDVMNAENTAIEYRKYEINSPEELAYVIAKFDNDDLFPQGIIHRLVIKTDLEMNDRMINFSGVSETKPLQIVGDQQEAVIYNLNIHPDVSVPSADETHPCGVADYVNYEKVKFEGTTVTY